MEDLDQKARKRIVEDTDVNFFVEAGAGSGKTSMLVERMLAMVKKGIPVEEITAITFTRAAANEFYSRFQDKLSRAVADPKLSEKERRHCARALENVDLCFMGTIDAFCSLIIGEHPREAGVPTGAEIIGKEELALLCRSVYYDAVSGVLGREMREKAKRFRTVRTSAVNTVRDYLPMFLEHRSAESCHEPPENVDFDAVWAEEIDAFRRLAKKLLSFPEDDAPIYRSNQDAPKAFEQLKANVHLLEGSWNRNLGELAYLFGRLEKMALAAAPETLVPAAAEFFEEKGLNKDGRPSKSHRYTLNSKHPLLLALKREVYRETTTFLTELADCAADELRRRGKLTYFDYLLYFRDMLRSDIRNGGNLISHVSSRHSRFLIDEFQDTNPLQAEIFFYLSAREPVEDWRRCVPRPGSLYIVGDPKQSIYRFRGADVSSYLGVKGLFTGEAGEVLPLTRNFRSSAPLRRFYNDVFSALLPAETAYQSRFSPIPVENSEEEYPYRGVYFIQTDNKGGRAIGPEQIIGEMLRNPAYPIAYQDENKECCTRLPEYRDFMLIFPRKSPIAPTVERMRRLGIPVRVEGNTAFSASRALGMLAALMGVFASQGDAGAVTLALQRVFRISERMLTNAALEGCSFRLYGEETEAAVPPIGPALAELREMARVTRALTPSAACRVLLDRFRLLRRSGTEDLEYLRFALELLSDAEEKGEVCSFTETAEFFRKLTAGDTDQERCLRLSESENAVHVANLHKVKGLQAPIVILADSARRSLKQTIWTCCSEGKAQFRCLEFGGRDLFPDLNEDEKDKEKAEKLRLDYVGATRAESYLIFTSQWDNLLAGGEVRDFPTLPCELSKEDEEAPKTPPKPAVDVSSRYDALYAEAKSGCELGARVSETPSYELRRPSAAAESVLSENGADVPTHTVPGKARELAMRMGTLTHRLLEITVSSGFALTPAEAAETVCREYDLQDLNPDAIRSRLTAIGETMRAGGFPQQGSAPQDLFAELRSAELVSCEVPFCSRDAEEPSVLWNGILDLVYRKNGVWHIVDYKTNADPSDLDEKYRAQLAAYRAAFQKMTGESADALIYHIGL